MDAVLFDFNGVLVDDEHIHFEGFNEVLAPLGVAMTPQTYAERYLGFDDRGALTAVLRDHGRTADDALVASLIERKSAVYARRAAAGEVRVFAGAAPLLTAVAARTRVAIVSGALRGEIESALGAMACRACVEQIVAAEDVRACKPDPEGYLLGLRTLADAHAPVRATHCVAIEDSVAGIESARAAGLRVVAVAHTYDRETLRRAGADAVFDTLAEVTVADLERVIAAPRPA